MLQEQINRNINTIPRIPLCVTAHVQRGTCSWCTPSQVGWCGPSPCLHNVPDEGRAFSPGRAESRGRGRSAPRTAAAPPRGRGWRTRAGSGNGLRDPRESLPPLQSSSGTNTGTGKSLNEKIWTSHKMCLWFWGSSWQNQNDKSGMRCQVMNFFNQEREFRKGKIVSNERFGCCSSLLIPQCTSSFGRFACSVQLYNSNRVIFFFLQLCMLSRMPQVGKTPVGSWGQLSQLSSSQLTGGVGWGAEKASILGKHCSAATKTSLN